MILAGGSGTRLWPASRRSTPKQFLALGGNEPLVAKAVRIGQAIAGDRVVIVTAQEQVNATRAVLGDIDLIVEPVGRNTAAAIGLAAATIERRDPDAVLAVLPADQHVGDPSGFVQALDQALAAAETTDAIATLGIPPTRAETGFGYLEVSEQVTPGKAIPITRFVEKPDRATAERYVASGRYLWNAGIFCATAKRLLGELDAHLPATAKTVREIAADSAAIAPALPPCGDFPPVGDLQGSQGSPGYAAPPPGECGSRSISRYASLAAISIDHAVMERASHIVTVPAEIGWDDVGSWAALPAIRQRDSAGNTVVGPTLILDGTNNVVVSDDETLIATVGVSDLVVIKSGNAILVVPRDQAQDVRKVVEALTAPTLSRFR